jgi:hypothetical protein
MFWQPADTARGKAPKSVLDEIDDSLGLTADPVAKLY